MGQPKKKRIEFGKTRTSRKERGRTVTMLKELRTSLFAQLQPGSPHSLCRPAGLEPPMEADVTHVYFHCASADEIYLDRRGTEVEDLVEAHQRAAQVVREFISTHDGPH